MQKVFISLIFLLYNLILLFNNHIWINTFFLYCYISFLVVTFYFSIRTIIDDKTVRGDYRNHIKGERRCITVFLILFYLEIYVLIRVILNEFWPENLITLFLLSQIPLILLILAEVFRYLFNGKITYLVMILFFTLLLLVSQQEFSNYLTGAAGILLISDLLFSSEIIEYLSTAKINEEVLNKIKTILHKRKDGWKIKINIVFISYSVTIALKNLLDRNFKGGILYWARYFLFRDIIRFDCEKIIIDRVLISSFVILGIISIYYLLMGILEGKILYKSISNKIDRLYDSI